MQSRIFPAIWKLIQQLEEVSKLSVAQVVHCDQRTAQRILTHMHVEGDIRICGWSRSGNSQVPIPIYILADGCKDVPRPKALTGYEIKKNYLVRHGKAGKKSIGIWGV